jgi:hypothetical protein
MDFDTINKRAQQSQYLLVKEKGEKVLDAKLQSERFINYLISYLEPHVEEVANAVIENDGKRQRKEIIVNDIVETYNKTDYIVESYKDPGPLSGDAISGMMFALNEYVEREYQQKLPLFDIKIYYSESWGNTVEYYIEIRMSYSKYFDYEVKFGCL